MTKERVSILVSIILLTIINFSTAQAATIMTHQRRIILDPGHGGKDTGLITPAKIQEQQVTLELAQIIFLKLADTFQVRLTRSQNSTRDTDVDTPQQKTVFANQMRADLFISIHLQQNPSGIPLIFYRDTSQATGTTAAVVNPSRRMAEITAGLFSSRQKRQAQILKTQIIPLEGLLMPGILIEPISISGLPGNPTDRKKILAPYAEILAAAIQNFFSPQN